MPSARRRTFRLVGGTQIVAIPTDHAQQNLLPGRGRCRASRAAPSCPAPRSAASGACGGTRMVGLREADLLLEFAGFIACSGRLAVVDSALRELPDVLDALAPEHFVAPVAGTMPTFGRYPSLSSIPTPPSLEIPVPIFPLALRTKRSPRPSATTMRASRPSSPPQGSPAEAGLVSHKLMLRAHGPDPPGLRPVHLDAAGPARAAQGQRIVREGMGAPAAVPGGRPSSRRPSCGETVRPSARRC